MSVARFHTDGGVTMPPELLAARWEDAVLREALAMVIGAVLIVLYLRWEWQQSAVDRDAREARRPK